MARIKYWNETSQAWEYADKSLQINNTYTLTAATSSALGGVIIGSNITNSNGTISLTSFNVTTALGYTPVTQNYVMEQIQAAIQASWEASY